MGLALPHGEVHLVEPNRIIVHAAVAVLLVIDRNAIPACVAGVAVDIQRVFDSVEGDGLVEQAIARRSLHLNHKVVPRIVFGVAGNTRRNPFLVDVIVSVPFVAAGDTAFVPPDVTFAALGAHELIDIELKCLGVRQVFRIKVNIVNEVMSIVGERVGVVRKSLSRKRSHEMVVPQNIGVGMRATY